MNFEILKFILTTVGLGLALISSILVAVAKNSKSAKTAKNATNLLSVISAVQTFISQAESIVGFTGANKKEWVMTKVNQFCISKGITYDDEEVDKLVEKFIDFSKQVNAKGEEEKL